ncbi:uncharacterized transporter [[Candida] jaroonii]|uniref:Uncharacterized transporter n=1 Tax=[Candida] jaroonii TaxID=467808 RepID=A0ACA9Y0X7_9ASCO|nr:uncharacterized transporter [[Candida] jaroonii]
MADESLYISTYEAALALVATSMKKARLRLDTLVVNSIMGGMLFSTGGMFHVILQSNLPETYKQNPGYVELLQGLCYPIGLFYVVTLGCELFNSNILFFSVGLVRGAVSVLDVLISWIVSWWFNLAANIFVCYVICYYSAVFQTEGAIEGSRYLLEYKSSFMFHQTLIKGIAGNFFVSLAIYLQIMAKPLHVKFFLMLLPIFTFVSIGFTHSVADMFVVTMGLINGGNVSVATVAWKVLLPGALGNIIGGSFFGIVIPWYSHIYTVEQDQKLLNLPKYELRDEQPEINTDSRVVRTKTREYEDEYDKDMNFLPDNTVSDNEKRGDNSEDTSSQGNVSPPYGIFGQSAESIPSRTTRTTNRSMSSLNPSRSRKSEIRSPKNVFPVYGMGEPLNREKSIASGYKERDESMDPAESIDLERRESSAEFMGSRIRNYLTRRFSKTDDPEQTVGDPSLNDVSLNSIRQYSVSSHKSFRTDRRGLSNRMINAGIDDRAMNDSDNVAGVSSPQSQPD